jgi:transposase
MKLSEADKSLLNLAEKQVRELVDGDREKVIFLILRLLAIARGALAASPSTPSAMIPPYEKPSGKKRGKKKPGRKKGHPGARRERPLRIDVREEHVLHRCPECDGEVGKPSSSRTRVIEDIPEIKPIATEHTIHRHYCPTCKKNVEPVVTDALPKSAIGNHVLALTAWLHYGLGQTISHIVEVLNAHLQLEVSGGGLVQMWNRLCEYLAEWVEEIKAEALRSAVLHADETGWRVDGQTEWLWCFTNENVTYYIIDRSRGSPALKRFFTESFGGTLVTDFWSAYNRVVCGSRQVCLVHLLRELEKVSGRNPSEEWLAFAKKLRRLLRDAIRLAAREDPDGEAFTRRRTRLEERVRELVDSEHADGDARRLSKRLGKYRENLFTFLDRDGVTFDNNHAEREIRPAVIMRKNSYANKSENGAEVQAALMSIYRTLKLRGHSPTKAVVEALREKLLNGNLPPLPTKNSSITTRG